MPSRLRLPREREYRRSIGMFEASRNAIEQDDLRISFLARAVSIESYEASHRFFSCVTAVFLTP